MSCTETDEVTGARCTVDHDGPTHLLGKKLSLRHADRSDPAIEIRWFTKPRGEQ